MNIMKIAIGNDHAGTNMKYYLINFLKKKGFTITNIGTNKKISVDYPDYGFKVAKLVSSKKNEFGIIICGTGIGISIAANKIKGIRAALCYEVKTAKLARKHNNANILALGARLITNKQAILITDAFLRQKFDEKKYINRINKINNFGE